MTETFIGKRLQQFTEPGSMGVVTDVTYWRCFWPALDQPTALFAEKSSGIRIMGSARNVIAPDDTEWLDYFPDALYPAELAVQAAFPGQRVGMVELTPEMVAVYMQAYDDAVASFPITHAVHSTRDDCNFLVHKEPNPNDAKRPIKYIAEIDKATAVAIAKGEVDVEAVKADADFIPINASLEDTVPVKLDEITGSKK